MVERRLRLRRSLSGLGQGLDSREAGGVLEQGRCLNALVRAVEPRPDDDSVAVLVHGDLRLERVPARLG